MLNFYSVLSLQWLELSPPTDILICHTSRIITTATISSSFMFFFALMALFRGRSASLPIWQPCQILLLTSGSCEPLFKFHSVSATHDFKSYLAFFKISPLVLQTHSWMNWELFLENSVPPVPLGDVTSRLMLQVSGDSTDSDPS